MFQDKFSNNLKLSKSSEVKKNTVFIYFNHNGKDLCFLVINKCMK